MSERSLLGKKWRVLNSDHSLSILEKLLINRGVELEEDIQNFLNPNTNKMHEPSLLGGMNVAVERIKKAILNQERIIIFGDYDVDGVTGTAILVLGLQEVGAQISYRLPSRTEDGYGLNKKIIDNIKESGTSLLITVDTGISCYDEVQYARDQGIDVIIPGGGIPMLLFSGISNHNISGAPVINGIPILIKMTEMAIKLKRLTGLSVSRTNDFIQPPKEFIDEFINNPKGL